MDTPHSIRTARIFAFGTALAALCLSGCIDNAVSGVSTPLEFCLDKAEVDCHVYFDCYDAARRNQLTIPGAKTWTSKADCEAKQKALCMPVPMVCATDLVFQEMRSSDCIKAWNVLSCEAWNQPEPPMPPACYKCDPVSKDQCVLSYCTAQTSI